MPVSAGSRYLPACIVASVFSLAMNACNSEGNGYSITNQCGESVVLEMVLSGGTDLHQVLAGGEQVSVGTLARHASDTEFRVSSVDTAKSVTFASEQYAFDLANSRCP